MKPLLFLDGLLFLSLLLPPVRSTFFELGVRWLYILLFSFSLTYALTPLVRSIAMKRGILDRPDERKVHLKPTPLLGGVAIYLGILGATGANAIISEGMMAVLLAGTLIMVFGLIDDAKGLPAGAKLFVQLLAAIVVMFSGKVLTLFPAGWLGTPLNLLITLLWIIGITNALNFFDGMDGLATGLAAIISFFLGMVALQTHQPLLGWFAVAIVGSCLGFLPYNLRLKELATIFLGDTGSSFLGFILACLAVKGNWADNNPIVSLSNPILIFGVLIYDMVHITVARVITGKVTSVRSWLEYVGQDHLHHRLAALLGSQKGSVFLIYLLSICLGLGAIVLRNARTVDAFLLLFQAAIIVVVFTLLEQKGRKQTSATVLTWTASAQKRLENIPSFVRSLARMGIEQYAHEKGYSEINDEVMQEYREKVGM